jgi:hypothetical protein
MNNAKSKKSEIIEQALQEAVGGGLAKVEVPICSVSCHIFSINVCHVDLCDVNLPF